MKRKLLPLLFLSTLTLAACSSGIRSDQTQLEPASVSTQLPAPANTTADPVASTDNDMTRVDQQGMVVVEVTPLNLDNPGDNLEFDVAMNTHSVDLSMDLAQFATLLTDAGVIVQATLWDAPRGGHHVSGKLIFPATKDGASILAGATKLIMKIRDVDVPMRTFEWLLK